MVSNIYIGTDIVSVPRLNKIFNSSQSDKFKNRIFTEKEIRYCDDNADSILHFAGRFAAKEAITKALLSSEKINSIKMNSIEIISGKNRKPEVNLLFKYKLQINCKVSISHTEEYATAFALIEL